jgi:tetratricopeptide (TPR) repeat protein
MRLPALLLLSAITPCLAQSVLNPPPAQQPANTAQPTMSAYAAQRENALIPAYAAERNRDYEGAYKLFKQVLEDYPRDARAMMLTANAATLAGHPEEAITLYERAIDQDKRNSVQMLPHLIQLYAQLNRWSDFDAARKQAREAALAGNKYLHADTGYIIEDYTDGARRIQVLEYPKLFGRFHTRYRFLTVSQYDPNTHFTPYTDLESDDIDQVSFKQQHPDKAAAGDRAFSLDTYPTPTSQALMRFFDGEPTYEEVRALAIGAPKGPTKLGPPTITFPTEP